MRRTPVGLLFGLALLLGAASSGLTIDSPVLQTHIKQIESLFRKHGLKYAFLGSDSYGRIVLRGEYADERAVNRAFSLAQTVVGVRWVSPVTPENIKVKAWESKMTNIIGEALKGSPSGRAIPSPSSTPASTSQPPPADLGKPGPVENKYAIVVGVGSFREGNIQSLRFSTKDAQDFYDYLASPSGGKFNKGNITLLLNENATKANIVRALEDVKRRANKNDLLVLFFSSHGTPPAPFGGVYIVTYDTVVKPRESVWETSISNEVLKDFITGVKAQRLLVVMDTCYSNGAYSHVPGFLPEGGKSLGADDEEGYGQSKEIMAKNLLGAKDIVLDDIALSHSTSQQASWGRVLFSSSTDGEKSWESDRLQNSYFTYHFLDGMKKRGTVRDAFTTAAPKVTAEVQKEKMAPQHPQVVADRKDSNFSLAQ